MGLDIVLLVLISAAIHPVWNLLVKKNSDPQLGFLLLTVTLSLCALVHGLLVGADFSAVFTVLPLVAVSVCGQLLYGTCLTATLIRGDLSAYYPIIRASPVFVVIVSVLFLGATYPVAVLLGIAMAAAGGFLLLYRRGSKLIDDPRTLTFALLAMAGTGIYSLADGRLMGTIEPQVLVFVVDGAVAPIYAILWFARRSANGRPVIGMGDLSVTYMVLPGIICYASYYLILLAYQYGGDVAAVTSMRQASIPVSVALGGLFLREGAMARRFLAAALLALGIVVIALNG
jgi:drug/metabolite transporter (DMT)-like permease